MVLVAQIALLIVAIVVFYIGLGVGLTQNPNMGTLLWIVAGLLFVFDGWWFLKSREKQEQGDARS